MAPRPGATGQGLTEAAPGRSAEVAVKCDLCKGVSGGPACVSACPTEAIARIDPDKELVELRALGGKAPRPAEAVRPSRRVLWTVALGAALAAVGVARLPLGKWTSGAALAALTVVLLAYGAKKRLPARWIRLGSTRVHYIVHLAVGALVGGLAAGHAGFGWATAGAAMARVAFYAALASGAACGAIYALVPGRLTRVEKKGLLPEDVAAHRRELGDRVFSLLTGKSELAKTLYAKVLQPYEKSRLGPLALLLSGRTLSAEQARLRARIDAMLGGRGKDKLAGVDDLVRAVVELRGLRAGAPLRALLAAALPLHLVVVLASIVAVAAHVWIALGHR
jgi:hypothetical protein